jgi:hypothetical protein
LLWYAVSDNFKNTMPDDTVLNSETPGLINVDGANDIVAVIIAPGTPVAGQNNRPSIDKADYLEGTNADNDASAFATSGGGEFNDQLVTITRQELMTVVEKRVINEVRAVLENYRNQYGAYPWMTPFADPKANFTKLNGVHTGGGDSSSLIDNTKDFTDWGVANGDIVRNISDGSIGSVSTVTSTTLTVSGLDLGDDNDFDDGDRYTVYTQSNSGLLSGTAMTGSDGTTLIDNNKDFTEIGVSIGDIVDKYNGTNMSSGMVQTVSSNQVTVNSLDGDAINAFSPGENYRIRSDMGVATAGSIGLVIEDTGRDFTVMGILPGDIIVNISDGSFGQISMVTANQLTVRALNFGTENDFDNGDYYYLPRHNTDGATREGLLSFHMPGRPFKTGFDFDWDITQSNGAQRVITVNTPSPDSTYQTILEGHIEGILGTVSVDFDDDKGQCVWTTESIVECLGVVTDNYLDGATTSGSNSVYLTDSSKDFIAYGIKAGDIVQNYDDTNSGFSGTADSGSGQLLLIDTDYDFSALEPYKYVFIKNGDLNTIAVAAEFLDGPNAGEKNTIRLIPSPADVNLTYSAGDTWQARTPQELIVADVPSSTTLFTVRTNVDSPDLDNDEYYRVLTATGRISGVADPGSTGTLLRDSSADFSNIEVGDIVENTDDGAFGVITSIPDSTSLNAQLYLAENPSSGTTRNFDPGENYVIHYDYVGTRRYEINTRYSGVTRVYNDNGVRKRDVCIGYEDASNNPDCSLTATTDTVTLPVNNNFATVTITDMLKDTENEASTATTTIDGTTAGSMKTSGIDFYLHVAAGELPRWFVKNKWHQLVYVSYSGGLAPGGTNCAPGMDCLNLSVDRPWGPETNNDIEALLVMSAGGQLADTIVPQDRSNADIADYFEDDNSDKTPLPDLLTFKRGNITNTFNDQISITVP